MIWADYELAELECDPVLDAEDREHYHDMCILAAEQAMEESELEY